MTDPLRREQPGQSAHEPVRQMRPSPEQAPAVFARGQDVVVTAGAGTGKTRTLVARYLALLAEGVPLRGIVAITFTLKAAREMRNRVRDEVRRYLSRVDLAPAERSRWQELYAGLDAARVGTIHSLCAEILSAHPAEARVDPQFEVLEEGQQSLLRGRVLDETMAWAADDADLVRLFPLLGEGVLRTTLDRLLASRLDARTAFAAPSEDPLADWRRALAERQAPVLEAWLGSGDWRADVAVLRENAASAPDDRMETQRGPALAAIQEAEEDGLPLAERLAALAQLDRISLVGGRGGDWPRGRPQLDAVKSALGSLRQGWRAHADLLGLALTSQDEALAQALPALKAAFLFAEERYERYKGERHALDFDDLEARALDLLRQHATVRSRWQRELHAILVDEFQDTNARQRDLVSLLNGEGGKLFVVGDAKQSIYRFRGADVTVFRAERERIAEGGGAAFELVTSYRAHRGLVDGLNALLRPVLGETPAPLRPWAEPFAPLVPHRASPSPGFAAPHIELHLSVGTKSGGALERAATALGHRLRQLVDGGLEVAEGGARRPLTYGDVAILCRATRSFAPYEDALERAGIPFLTVAGRGFFGRPEVRDLVNALQALDDPTDDLALFGLLRSPAFALSDAALFRLCQSREQTPGASLWALLQGAGPDALAEEAPPARRAARAIAELHELAGRTAVADLLKELLDRTDYRAALLQVGDTRGARNVEKLLTDAHASGAVMIGEFLEYAAGLREGGVREAEARATAEGAVQIMTVHAAKGLEFPIVVVGDATYSGGGGPDLLVDPELGPLLSLKDDEGRTPAIYRLGMGRETDQAAAEAERLLYVAATRAREKLIFSGCVGLQKDGTVRRVGGWLGDIGGSDGGGLIGQELPYQEAGSAARSVALEVDGVQVACTVYEPGFTAQAGLPSVAALSPEPELFPLPPPLLAPIAPPERLDRQDPAAGRETPQRVWRVVPTSERPRAPAWVVGSLVHAALGAWRFPEAGPKLGTPQHPAPLADVQGSFAKPAKERHPQPVEGFDRWAAARARGYGLTDPRQLADAVRRCRRLLIGFRSHSLYQQISEAERRLHELPYSLPGDASRKGADVESSEADDAVLSGVMDVLFLRDGQWTVVEFKTDAIRDDGGLVRLLDEQGYRVQARRYANAVERLVGQRPRCLLCMLNYAGGVRLYELSTSSAPPARSAPG